MASPEYGLPTSENYFADAHDCGDANFVKLKFWRVLVLRKYYKS